jgi:hypothetical protein
VDRFPFHHRKTKTKTKLSVSATWECENHVFDGKDREIPHNFGLLPSLILLLHVIYTPSLDLSGKINVSQRMFRILLLVFTLNDIPVLGTPYTFDTSAWSGLWILSPTDMERNPL